MKPLSQWCKFTSIFNNFLWNNSTPKAYDWWDLRTCE